jgi:hypothetical protein
MEILSRWKLRKINSDVPLYDPAKKTYAVIIDDDMVDIPEDLFLKLFERIELPHDKSARAFYLDAKRAEESLETDHPEFDTLATLRQRAIRGLKDQMKIMIRLGYSKDETIQKIKEMIPEPLLVHEADIMQMIGAAYDDALEEVKNG